MPKLVVTGNFLPHDGDKCAPTFLQGVRTTGSMIDCHEALVHPGPLDEAKPCASGLKPSDEPDVWSLDAELGVCFGHREKHTESCVANNRSIWNLSVDGLDVVDSGGSIKDRHQQETLIANIASTKSRYRRLCRQG